MSAMVFDLDDLCDEFDPWEELHALKEKFPNLKVTLFAIPARCSDDLLARYRALDWVELGVHGYHHSSQECLVWSYEETNSKLEELEKLGWGKVFKAPGWQLNEQAYAALFDRGWVVSDHASYAWPSMDLPLKRFTYNLPGNDAVPLHGHTWDTCGNGPSAWESMFAEIDPQVTFAFVSEVASELAWGYAEPELVQDSENSWSHESVWGKMALDNFNECFADLKGLDIEIGDFGGNDGFVAANSGFNVTVLDVMPNRVRHADQKYGVPALCVNLEKLPLKDGVFDWGYCSHTLEHVKDCDAAWAEIQRVCRHGCYVVLPVEDEDHFKQNPAHYHRDTHEGWCERFGLEEIKRYPDAVVGVWRR